MSRYPLAGAAIIFWLGVGVIHFRHQLEKVLRFLLQDVQPRASSRPSPWPAIVFVVWLVAFAVLFTSVIVGAVQYRWLTVASGLFTIGFNAQIADTFRQTKRFQHIPRRMHQTWLVAVGLLFVGTGLFGSVWSLP